MTHAWSILTSDDANVSVEAVAQRVGWGRRHFTEIFGREVGLPPRQWVRIPVVDLERAAVFYEAVFGVSLFRETVAGIPHAIFPIDDVTSRVTGALVTRAPTEPGARGAVIYLLCEDADAALDRAVRAGAKVVMPALVPSRDATCYGKVSVCVVEPPRRRSALRSQLARRLVAPRKLVISRTCAWG